MIENTPPVAAREHTVESFTREFLRELNFGQGVDLDRASANDKYLALSRTVRHYLTTRWLETLRNQYRDQAKTVAYLSAEFLLGPQLENAMLAADLDEIANESLRALGVDLDELRALEIEPGLGNGGLGRLAACFIDSLATLNVPSVGYGIRYEYGIFRQTFEDGAQVEKPDTWLRLGSPWELPHPEHAVEVSFGGHTVEAEGGNDGARTWVPDWRVAAVPYNYMVPGYRNGRVNTLRLWSARATHEFDLQIFNAGDYAEAVRARTFAENISKVLYPEDSTPQGKELRLQQQYFFVAASLRDFLETVLPADFDLHRLPDRITWQLNDTHPVIAVPELMRILVDERGWDWADAWAVTQKVFAYTCHTLLPEALEVWSVDLLGRLLPRHLEIIYRINEEFIEEVRAAFPGDELRVRRMSIIAEQPERAVRMAHLATVAGFKVNGVAELHSQLLADKVLHDFAQMWPGKFTNVTNGVTPVASCASRTRGCRGSSPRRSATAGSPTSSSCGASSRSRTTPSSAAASARSRPPTSATSRTCSSRVTASRSRETRWSTRWSSACTSTSDRASSCCTSCRSTRASPRDASRSTRSPHVRSCSAPRPRRDTCAPRRPSRSSTRWVPRSTRTPRSRADSRSPSPRTTT
ncbi:hypothetical protein GCM10025873_21160 [Demequina sediminis]|nr:hypothetical protein GCM10025873_21160 [Demequina sediminis]